jgi:septum site-determining protein MinC
MSANVERADSPVFELKARAFTLPTLRLLGGDMDRVADGLAQKVSQAPDFFRNTPVVIDLEDFVAGNGVVDFALLVGLLRGYGMVPVGVRGGNAAQNEAAQVLELAILASAKPAVAKPKRAAPAKPPPEPKPAATAAAARPGGAVNKLVTRPVRSGQRVYAAGGDLIVTAQVSAGAELLADGNIHVYSALRGRALAGVKGNRESRIFCQNLQAELVSVAGHYRLSENLQELAGRAVQIHLDDRSLVVEPF